MATIKLYIRKKPSWINYVGNVQEFKDFIDYTVISRPVVIGDLATFNRPMKSMLLKFIEDHDNVSLYSSTDIQDPVILSRVAVIEKELVDLPYNGIDLVKYEESNKDYSSVLSNLSSLPSIFQLRAAHCSTRAINLLVARAEVPV